MNASILVPWIAWLLLLPGTGAPRKIQAAPVPAALTVSHRARTLQAGEAVVLVVSANVPLTSARASAFGREIPVVRQEADGRWWGLIGIDVEASPGRHEVSVEAQGADGVTLSARHVLTIKAREFPVRRLSVDDAFVNPPASTRARIQAEAKTVEAVLARVTRGRRWEGGFARPVPGEATSGFGRRSILNGEVRSIHAGVDFRAANGTPVRAPADGRVALAAEHYFAGKLVIIDHGLGLFSFLAHLSSVSVTEGQGVSRGDVVGLSGATGRVTGPHLHWSIRLSGARVDPLSVVALSAVEPAARDVVR